MTAKNEIWKKWIPFDNLSTSYTLDNLIDKTDTLIINLSNTSPDCQHIKVSFNKGVYIYRVTDEIARIGMSLYFGENKKLLPWPFFKIEHSHYLNWLSQESCTTCDEWNLQHYCIYTTDTIVDILAIFEPIIEAC